jgi:hypothetical protein
MNDKNKKPVYGPGNKQDYDAFGFRNNIVDVFTNKKVGTPGAAGTTFVTKKPETKA